MRRIYVENRCPAKRKASQKAADDRRQAKKIASEGFESKEHKSEWLKVRRKARFSARTVEKYLRNLHLRLEKLPERQRRHEESVRRYKERDRRRALAAYHANRDKINAARRIPLSRQAEKAAKRVERWLAELRLRLRRWRPPTDPAQKRLRKALRRRLEKAIAKLKGRNWGSLTKRARELLGCTLPELQAHLEARFQPGMTWDNHGYGPTQWNVDHIKPVASFDLSDEGQARECFHFTNLQPLWHLDNMKKRNKPSISDPDYRYIGERGEK